MPSIAINKENTKYSSMKTINVDFDRANFKR